MQLREVGKTGAKVSPLGFGMMRLPMKDGGQAEALTPADKVDVEESIKMLRHAIDNGVNYVDTAFNYIGGMSEKITGMALEDGYREKVYLATKSPTWMYKSEDDFDSLLAKQLQRLKTDYIDFYMLHSINGGSWEALLEIWGGSGNQEGKGGWPRKAHRFFVPRRLRPVRRSAECCRLGFRSDSVELL